MWAMMQKLRMKSGLVFAGSSLLVARGDKVYLFDGFIGTTTYILAQMVALVA
jgi:hypothetical protein